ncbi:MAG: hypothetical protein FI698_06815 [SAR202 cluster bacterium]|nr:hypothetical protein [SAR202 cluster bacterium]
MKKYLAYVLVVLIIPFLIAACDYNWGFGQGKKDSEIISTQTDQFSKGESIAVVQTWLINIGDRFGINERCLNSLLGNQVDWVEEVVEAGVWHVSAKSKPDDSEEVIIYFAAQVYEGTNSIMFSVNNLSKMKGCN